MAGPDIRIQSMVEKEVTVTENGQKVTKLVTVSSGGIASSPKLYFTLTITNDGDEVATNVVVDNPIPPETIYAVGSATGEKGVVSCSVDDGVSFHSENEQLFNPGRYTDIRWVIDEMPPGSSCKLGFQIIASFWTISSRRIMSLVPRYSARVRNDQ